MTAPAAVVPVRTVEISDPGPLPLLMPDDGLLFSTAGDGLVAWGEHRRFHVRGPDRIGAAQERLDALVAQMRVVDEVRLPGTGPVAFAAFTFDAAAAGSVVVVPRVVIGRRDGRAWRTDVGDPAAAPLVPAPASLRAQTPDRVRYAGSTASEITWLAAVDTAVERIRAHDADKVVLARDRRVWSRTPFEPARLVRHLAARHPECQTFSVDGLVGASPEILVRRLGDELTSLVLAGTAARGPDAAADVANAAALRCSDKDLREHGYAVASIRAALDGVVEDLDVSPQPEILALADVMHLATAVHARVVDPAALGSLALAGLLHPNAAICGAPVDAAKRLIDELERMERARYSGPVGWTDARGDGQWALALRCAEIDGARARLFAGAGIVDGSLPEDELEETRLKLRAMQRAFEASPR